jgi:hypothetical protein
MARSIQKIAIRASYFLPLAPQASWLPLNNTYLSPNTGHNSLLHLAVGVLDPTPEPTSRPTTFPHNTMAYNNAYQQAPSPQQGPSAPSNHGWYNNYWQAGADDKSSIRLNHNLLPSCLTPTQYALSAAALPRTVNINMDTINKWVILDSGTTSNFLITSAPVTSIQLANKPIVCPMETRSNPCTHAHWIYPSSQLRHALPTSSHDWHCTHLLVWWQSATQGARSSSPRLDVPLCIVAAQFCAAANACTLYCGWYP